MEIQVQLNRQTKDGKAIKGLLFLPFPNKPLIYETIENADFLIPEGKYPLKITWSPRFKKPMPEICDVPEREGILIIGAPENPDFWGERRPRETYPYNGVVRQSEGTEREHMGTKPEHSQGCVLVSYAGLENTKAFINYCKKWFEDEEVFIEISFGARRD